MLWKRVYMTRRVVSATMTLVSKFESSMKRVISTITIRHKVGKNVFAKWKVYILRRWIPTITDDPWATIVLFITSNWISFGLPSYFISTGTRSTNWFRTVGVFIWNISSLYWLILGLFYALFVQFCTEQYLQALRL